MYSNIYLLRKKEENRFKGNVLLSIHIIFLLFKLICAKYFFIYGVFPVPYVSVRL